MQTSHENTSPGRNQVKLEHALLSEFDFNAKNLSARTLLNEHKRIKHLSVPILLSMLIGLLYGMSMFGSTLFEIDVVLAAGAIAASAYLLKLVTKAPIFALLTYVLARLTPIGQFHRTNKINIGIIQNKIAAIMGKIDLADFEALARLTPDTQDRYEVIMSEKHEIHGFRAFIENPTLMFMLLELLLELQDLAAAGEQRE